MIAVIFEVEPRPGCREAYLDAAARLKPLLAQIDGFISVERFESLTQPGKIAIVYSQHKELLEYLEYIEFLQGEKLLGDNIEHLDLEDTQGINGLKAVRVEVLFDPEPQPAPKEGFTKVSKEQLAKKEG